MKRKILFLLNILLIVVTLANITFANAYLKDGYELIGSTIKNDDITYNMY